MAHGMPTRHWPFDLTPVTTITTNTLIHSHSSHHSLPSLCVFSWHVCETGVFFRCPPSAHMHDTSKNKLADLGLSVWSSDSGDKMVATPELNLITDRYKLFRECIWIWALVLCMSLCTRYGLLDALYGTIDPLIPLHVQLNVFNLPSNSDDLGLHIDVVWEASLCFACAWIRRCTVCERGESVRLFDKCVCVSAVNVCLQLVDKSRNLRQVRSICPWFEHCTNPTPTWNFQNQT